MPSSGGNVIRSSVPAVLRPQGSCITATNLYLVNLNSNLNITGISRTSSVRTRILRLNVPNLARNVSGAMVPKNLVNTFGN